MDAARDSGKRPRKVPPEQGNIDTLRRISPIAYAFEQFFHLGSQNSPERLFGPTRVEIQQSITTRPTGGMLPVRGENASISTSSPGWVSKPRPSHSAPLARTHG